jgi:putative FmdB family regulatory protein
VPTYAYKCTNCGHQYETRESFDAPPRQECPKCGEVAKRVLFAPPIVFKGSGFYITDSRKGSSATIGADGGGSTPAATSDKPAASTPSAATDSKPAATATASDD